jgi:hypothetical protein
MNAKEKAKELQMLFLQYASQTHTDNYGNDYQKFQTQYENAKECVLIMVNEILKIKLWGKTDKIRDRQFWEDVKAEILNVQPGNDMQCGVGKNNI